MATSSLANFFSLFIPSKAPPQPPKAPPSHLSISTESSSSSGYRHGFAPMVAASNSSSSSSSSSFPLSSCSDDLMSVVCPSLAYANTLYFSAKYNIQLEVNDNEPSERVLGRWRREVMKTGILQEYKRRMHFENKQEERKRRRVDAAKRNRRRRGPYRSDDKEEDGDDEFKKVADDNWGMMEDDDEEDYTGDTYEQVMEALDDEDE